MPKGTLVRQTYQRKLRSMEPDNARAPPQWHEDRNAGIDAANKSGSGAGSDHGLWKGRVLRRVDIFELRSAQIQCDTLHPLRSRPTSGGRTLPTKLHQSQDNPPYVQSSR